MAGTITVFGGTGFIGRHLVGALLQSGAAVRLVARHPGQVKKAAEPANAPEIVQGDILDDVSVGAAITGADAVVNLVGILTETATQTYRAIHIEGARRVGQGSTAPWRDEPDPHIGPRRQPDIAGDLGPDKG